MIQLYSGYAYIDSAFAV